MRYLEKLEREILSWPEVSAHEHRFGGREFRYRSAEIGHAHTGGIVDIPFPCSIRNELLAEGLAEEHRWVPNSGWVTYHVHGEEDFNHALWLMQLSYLRYALKGSGDPQRLLEEYGERLHLTSGVKSLFEPLMPKPIA
jgi:Family of unknown function (DUF5519)